MNDEPINSCEDRKQHSEGTHIMGIKCDLGELDLEYCYEFEANLVY